MLVNNFYKTGRPLRVRLQHTVQNCLGIPFDNRDRSTQFVRDIGNKVAAHVLNPLHFGNILENRHHPLLTSLVHQGNPVG